MAVKPEAPIKRDSVIYNPDKRIRGVRKTLAITAAATTLAVAGIFGYEALQPNKQAPEKTPIIGGIGEATPYPSPEITIFPSAQVSPTPEITLSPTPDLSKWYNLLPPNKYEGLSLDKIPLTDETIHDGSMFALVAQPGDNPDYSFRADYLTLFKVEPDNINNIIWVWAGLKGNNLKITQEAIYPDPITGKVVNLDTWEGLTIKIGITNNNPLWKYKIDAGAYPDSLGKGLKSISPYLEVGTDLSFDITFQSFPIAPLTNMQLKTNLEFLNKLGSSQGFPNTRDNPPFVAYASGVYVSHYSSAP